jgi:N-acetylglucosamine kinase-like BadF-type ATPase
LNSSVARFVAGTYIVGTQISTHVVEYIKVPAFEKANKAHVELAELSEECHSAAKKGDESAISVLERKIDKAAAKLWGITDDELKAIQKDLAESGRSKRAAAEDEE